jgi:drug/metabolite transporter (DMT)-like permease
MAKALKKGYLDVVFVVRIWSGFVLVSRIGGKSELLSYDVVALRFGTAAVLILPYWIFRNKVNLLQTKLFILSLVGGIGYCTLVYYGFRFAPASHAGILLPGLLPFEATIFSFLLLGEHPSRWRLAGLGSIALGVIVLAVENMKGSSTDMWVGDVSFVAAGTCWAIYSVLVRKWQVAPLDATVALALLSAVLYLPVYGLFLPRHIALASWGTIAFQAFYQGVMAMIVAMIFYMRAMKALGPSSIGLFMALVPVIAGMAAVPLLNEPLTAAVMVSLFCVSFGAWLGSRKSKASSQA